MSFFQTEPSKEWLWNPCYLIGRSPGGTGMAFFQTVGSTALSKSDSVCGSTNLTLSMRQGAPPKRWRSRRSRVQWCFTPLHQHLALRCDSSVALETHSLVTVYASCPLTAADPSPWMMWSAASPSDSWSSPILQYLSSSRWCHWMVLQWTAEFSDPLCTLLSSQMRRSHSPRESLEMLGRECVVVWGGKSQPEEAGLLRSWDPQPAHMLGQWTMALVSSGIDGYDATSSRQWVNLGLPMSILESSNHPLCYCWIFHLKPFLSLWQVQWKGVACPHIIIAMVTRVTDGLHLSYWSLRADRGDSNWAGVHSGQRQSASMDWNCGTAEDW